MKNTLTLFTLLLICSLSFSKNIAIDDFRQMDSTARAKYFQEHKRKIDRLSKLDYLSYDYKYLDKDFKINISSELFEKTVKDYDFYRDRIVKYKDSIEVVLMAEFNDWDQVRIAGLTIGYTWLRLGYHTWQSEKEAKEYANSFGIKHPWRMREFLNDEQNDNANIVAFLDDLRTKVKLESKKEGIEQLNRAKLLDEAMRCNPQRILDYGKMVKERKKQEEAYQKEHGNVDQSKLGVGCGKANCCQSKRK